MSSALLGTQRRPVPLDGLPPAVAAALAEATTGTSPDAATTLLDTAALLTVYRRAGAGPLRGRRPVPAAPEEEAAPPSALAAARLRTLLAQLAPDRPAATADVARLLEEWFAAVAGRGLVAPPALLPDLLDLAVRRRELRPAIARVLGTRGRWLAAFREDWRTAVDGPSDGGAPQDPWTLGTPAQRRAWLGHLRAADPAAAREALLALDWRAERAEDRLAFVSLLADGLSLEDEELLDRVRSDRRQDVRAAAARLLTLLPDSAYAQRLISAARACLRVERQRLRRVLVVSLPDPQAPIAGELPLPPAPVGVGPAVWLLRHLLAVPPPTEWERAFGADAETLVGMPVADGLADTVHGGWAEAAVGHGNATWARALLGAPGDDLDRPGLLRVLPAGERVEAAVAALRRVTNDPAALRSALAALTACPAPWPEPLARAFLEWLARTAASGPPWPVLPLLAAAKFALPPTPATVAAARDVAEGQPPEGVWRVPLVALAHTLAIRHQMLEELR